MEQVLLSWSCNLDTATTAIEEAKLNVKEWKN